MEAVDVWLVFKLPCFDFQSGVKILLAGGASGTISCNDQLNSKDVDCKK